MSWLTSLNARLSRWALYIAVTALTASLLAAILDLAFTVGIGVDPLDLLFVVSFLFLLAAACAVPVVAREWIELGVVRLLSVLPEEQRSGVRAVLYGTLALSGFLLVRRSIEVIHQAGSVLGVFGSDTAWMYLPLIVAGALVVLFSLERLPENWLTSLNSRLSRWALYIAVTALLSIVGVVFYGVVMRYIFHNAPPWMEQVALILVITVAMSAAAVTVREDGHIGMDSLVIMLPAGVQRAIGVIVGLLTISFGCILFYGSLEMALAVRDNMIPTLGISEATRYSPCVVAGVLIVLFAIEQLLAMLQGKEVVKSWH